MIYSDPVVAAPRIAAAFAQARRVLLLTHVNPDGDAIGSMLALWHTLQGQGKSAIALASSPFPGLVRVLPGIDHVQIYDRGMSLPDFDLVCLLDAFSLERTGPVYEEHTTTLSVRPLVVIDHHLTQVGEGATNLIVPGSASCADLLYRLLLAMGTTITPTIATCLLMGIITDTQSFQTGSTNAGVLQAAADLVALGANHQSIIRSVYYATPYTTTQLIGLSLNQMQREGSLIWTSISQDMVRQTGAEDGATDEVIQMMQRIDGVRVCAIFKERQDGDTKLSLRSVKGIDVAAVARTWGGGGHAQASGATLPMSLEDAPREVLPLLRSLLP